MGEGRTTQEQLSRGRRGTQGFLKYYFFSVYPRDLRGQLF